MLACAAMCFLICHAGIPGIAAIAVMDVNYFGISPEISTCILPANLIIKILRSCFQSCVSGSRKTIFDGCPRKIGHRIILTCKPFNKFTREREISHGSFADSLYNGIK